MTARRSRSEPSSLAHHARDPRRIPHVMFDVEVDWKPYQEMHVGGSAEAQFFLYPPTLHLSEPAAGGFPWHKLPPGLERTDAVPLELPDSN